MRPAPLVSTRRAVGNGNGRRSHLDSNRVYKSEPPGTLESFKHLLGVRDKHVAHDVNPYAKAAVAAAINNAGNSTKIETIVTAAFYLETLDQTQYANLRNLVQKAIDWVTAEFDAQRIALKARLESVSYDKLIAMPALTVTTATVSQAWKPR